MADYLTIAVIHILVGFEMTTLGMLNTSASGEDEEALFVIGFCLYLASAILVALIKGGDLAGNMIAMICTLIAVLVASVFIIAGAAIWYDDIPNNSGEYVMTLDCTGGILGAIGGIFLIVVLANGGGGGSTSPA